MSQDTWDVIIAGGGSAGLSAALLLGRARRRVLVLDSGAPRNRFAANMHGVLGSDGKAPERFLAQALAEIAKYGVEVQSDPVVDVTIIDHHSSQHHIEVTTESGRVLHCRRFVAATGASDRLPDIPGLQSRWGRDVLHCPYCHGWEVRDQRFGVISSGPRSLHQAQLVRQWTDDVTFFAGGAGRLDDQLAQTFAARNVAVEERAVTEIVVDDDRVVGVRVAGGALVPLDVVFVASELIPHDGFLAGLDLERDAASEGGFIKIDASGRTSDPRIWAIGNIAEPMATVPVAVASGVRAAGAINMDLVDEDFAVAVEARSRGAQGSSDPVANPDAVAFWETRYQQRERIWSGLPNTVLVDLVSPLSPGTALDLGCGEGADSIWLAQQGWAVTGVDISTTALARAERHAEEAGLPAGGIRWQREDLATLSHGQEYDLVSAFFLHSQVDFPREEILRRAAAAIAPGGVLLVVGHSGVPPWAKAGHEENGERHGDQHHHAHGDLPSPQEVLDSLELAPADWQVVVAEIRTREVIQPDGERGSLDDAIVMVRRGGTR